MDHSNHNHDHAVHKHENGGNGHHHGMFKQRFRISLIVTLPVLALAPTIQGWLGFSWEPAWGTWALLILSSFIFFYGGWPFLKGLYDELKKGNPGMMTLIAVAPSVAWAYSAAVALGLPGKTFFWELVTLIDIMLLGHWIEMRVMSNASRALERLAEFLPAEAHRLNETGAVEDIPLKELKKGDQVLIKADEKIPADGKITDGESNVDEHMVTGESVPVKKGKGDELIGETLNGRNSLKMEVIGIGEESYLNRVYTMVRDAQGAKSKTQHLADRAAKWLTVISLSLGSGTDVAAETADIILTRSNPKDITGLIDFGRATYGKMIQNLFWATGYNVITIPLAAGVLYPVFVLSPAVRAVIMSLSTIIVALNAMTLKRKLNWLNHKN